MKISKCSLRTLPVMLLLEMLSPALMLAVLLAAYFVKKLGGEPAAAAVAILAGMAVMGVWILCTVLLYGIMELSHFFAYAWYLHLIYFVIKSVSLVLEGYNAAYHGAGAETAGLLGDLLSSGQQLVGMLSHSMILFGVWSEMKKMGHDKLSQICRVYELIYLSAGILLLLSDGAEYLVSRLNPEAADSFSVETTAVVAVNTFLTAAASFIGIPAFLAFRRSCMAVYTLLFNTREG